MLKILFAFTEDTMDRNSEVTEKKLFNKKKWREKKYGHGHKVDQWKDKHKLAAKMKYKRLLKKEEKNNPNFVQHNKVIQSSREKNTKTSAFSKAVKKYDEQDFKKQLKKEEFLKKQEEKNEAVKKYKEKKAERLKVLNAKTKRGQPKMGGRIELLLAKIEEQCKDD